MIIFKHQVEKRLGRLAQHHTSGCRAARGTGDSLERVTSRGALTKIVCTTCCLGQKLGKYIPAEK